MSSRVRVLNLPHNVTEADLRRHFSQQAGVRRKGQIADAPLEITDCKIVTKRPPREGLIGHNVVRMGFVGFRTAAAGARAVKTFNGSYLGSQKLAVEPAMSLAEQRAAAAASKASAHTTARSPEDEESPSGTEPQGKKGPLSEREKLKQDFVAAQLARAAAQPGWKEELLQPTQGPLPSVEGTVSQQPPQDTRKLQDEEIAEKQKRLEAVDDADFLASIISNVQQQEDRGEVSACPREDRSTTQVAGSSAPLKKSFLSAAQKIASDSRRVRVSNIPYDSTLAEVKSFLASLCKGIDSIHMPLTKDTKQSKGVVYVSYHTAEAAVAALQQDGAIFQGRVIRVVGAPPDPYQQLKQQRAQEAAPGSSDQPLQGQPVDGPTGAPAACGGGRDSFKAQKLEKRKENEGSLMWNPLFVGSSAAVAKVSRRLGSAADQLINVSTTGAAVKAAIAEAFLTSEARRTLGEEGINFSAVEDTSLHRQRSNTTILVKHLPPNMSLRELSQLFSQYGQLEAVAAPPSTAFALLSFVHESDAKVAFQKLAYKMVGGRPLFLEWAPIGSIKDPDDDLDAALFQEAKEDLSSELTKAALAQRKDPRGLDDGIDDDDERPAGQTQAEVAPVAGAAVAATTVYVTNLPFGLTDAAFASFLQSTCKRLASKPELLLRTNHQDTKGRAFITVADAATANYVISKLAGRSLEGRALQAQLSKNPTTHDTAKHTAVKDDPVPAQAHSPRAERIAEDKEEDGARCPPGHNPLKVVVKNLPFEATERDLRQLFSAFTEIKAVRVPQKVHTFGGGHHENNHRGFGFVEFLTEQEAANAIATLSNTHLYGRHLVLQYAKL